MRAHTIPTPPSSDDDSPSSPVVLKKEEPASTPPSSTTTTFTFNLPSTPLTTWPYPALHATTQSVSPSQLVLTGLIGRKRRSVSPASSDDASSPPPTSGADQPPPSKKTKRKARTEEEKEARALERTMRNRRAAQESRDRKKRQFESLEEENRRLQEENAKMKARIEQLESQQFQLVSTHPTTMIPLEEVLAVASSGVATMEVDSPSEVEVQVKEEENCIESTFHPAVMESVFGQQCLSSNNSLPCTTPRLTTKKSPTPSSFSAMAMMLLPLLSWTLLSVLIRIYMKEEDSRPLAFLLKMMVPPISAPATFNSLNTGSLFTGAEMGCVNVVSSRVGFERGRLPLSAGSMDGLVGNPKGVAAEQLFGDVGNVNVLGVYRTRYTWVS